jgi:hypothetical protein
MATIPSSRHLLVRFQRDWEHLARSRTALARARTWPLGIGPIRSLDDLLRRTGHRPADGDDGRGRWRIDNRVLATLVRIAADDDLAARIVLQRLLPGLSALARRYSDTIEEQFDALDEAVSAAWIVIRLYPSERRTGFVAATLLRDVEYVAFRRRRRRKGATVPTPRVVFELIPMEPAPTAAEELAELLDDARAANFAAADVELAERLGDGATVGELAAERKVTPRTVRNHRRVVAYRLRRLARECA